MKYLIIIITALLMLSACDKETEPNCGRLYYEVRVYDNNVIVEHITTDFGTICGEDYLRYRNIVSKQSVLGEQLCPPEQRYGRWVMR